MDKVLKLHSDNVGGLDPSTREDDDILTVACGSKIGDSGGDGVFFNKFKRPTCKLSINGCEIIVLADSGSPYTLVSEKKVIKICKNAVKLEDGNWWNKESLSLARDVELLDKTWDESTKVEHETKDILRNNSLCDVKVLDKKLVRPSKEGCVTKDMKRKTSSRNKMLPRKFCDFVLLVQ
ncbi:hypothetical protein NDU88_001720 [Pleurodeles waltl]|uniref:Uncharacterized protein n=1 Tax=Pleurodeles waltl TaxID=8319 RepID=A0AAV7NBX6_PLEWA|nr:hypothetical protein NDU88_001720 [Pleurodeles waltl]